MSKIDYYGETDNYIHLKWGEARKMYNFTDEFREKYPNFCAEYKKFWVGDETGVFKDSLHVVNYVDNYNIPVHFYFNYTDTPVNDISEVYEYLIKEHAPRTYELYKNNGDYFAGMDGEQPERRVYSVRREE